MIRAVAYGAGLLCLASGAALAQADPLPDFQTCMDIDVGRFEWRLQTHSSQPAEVDEAGPWDVAGVYYCGSVGIVGCDRSGAPVPCQHDLARDQDAMTAAVLGTLPAPEALGAGEGYPAALYRQVFALAHGRSAGPDCAGANKVMEAWCEAREASSRLQTAVLSWQVARYLDAAPTGVAAGWVNPPPRVRPRPRPAR